MTAWNTAEAQSHFSDLLRACASEPQMLCDHDRPVAVLLDIRAYRELMARKPANVPTMAELHEKLKAIRALEPDIEISPRVDRPNPFLGEYE